VGGPWRDAAQVVPLRPAGAGFHIFLFRRKATLRAFPGVWAFPGGSIDEADRAAAAGVPGAGEAVTAWFREVEAGPLAVNQTAFMTWAAPRFRESLGYVPVDAWHAVDHDPVANAASVVAVRRELAEETGWMLVDGPPPWHLPDHLGYLGRLMTPPHEPVRFESRIFVAFGPPGLRLRCPPGEGDVADWYTPAEALHLPALAMPTRYLLERLNAVAWDDLRRWSRPPADWGRFALHDGRNRC
jgi:8-oxo-dGTP pyrophosphatase MutT (NUDIX family)